MPQRAEKEMDYESIQEATSAQSSLAHAHAEGICGLLP
jgi:hypothetical protein